MYVAANATIDYETTHALVLTVEAFDSPDTPSTRRRATASVHVTIVDANDNRPRFRDDSLVVARVTVATAAVDSHLATVQADDADSGLNGEVIFSIDSGNDEGTSTVILLAFPIEADYPIGRVDLFLNFHF